MEIPSRPELQQGPDYDNPSIYNPFLYPLIERTNSANRLSSSALHLGAGLGQAMLKGARAMGIRNPNMEEADLKLEALSTMSERNFREFDQPPEFGLHSTEIDGVEVSITEEMVEEVDTPFSGLMHFKREFEPGEERHDPPVLIVVPISGHYSTLLRNTVEQFLPYHDVYVTITRNARDIPTSNGTFDVDDHAEFIESCVKKIGPETNMVAVCQAAVPGLIAASHLAETEPDNQPNSTTLMGGPIDAGAAPSVVTKFADQHALSWFENNLIAKVPGKYEGKGRRVYPGALQFASFVNMNPRLHHRRQWEYFENLTRGNMDDVETHERFYDEYRSVLDIDAPFYLQTINEFKERLLANGKRFYRGSRVDPAAIIETALMTVEGSEDDISTVGQTTKAHELTNGLNEERHFHYEQEGVGHYGIFSGSAFRGEIYPRIAGFIRESANRRDITYDPVPETSKLVVPENWGRVKVF